MPVWCTSHDEWVVDRDGATITVAVQ